MIIATKTHPLKQRPDQMYFSAWRSIDALSRTVAKTIPVHVIHVNGEQVHTDDYDRILYESDRVTVCGVPGDPGTALGVFLISLAISASLTALTVGLTLLLRPKGPKGIGGPDQQTQSITGVGNQTDPFGAITKVYGNVRIYPKFPGKVQTQYTEIVGSDQYLRFLLLVCRGPVTLTRQELKIGETSIENFQDVELNILEGRSTDPPLTIYTRDVRETSLAVGLTQAADWQQQTTELDADEISVDWSFLRGLQHATKNGGRDAITVNVQIEYSLVGSGVWQQFGQSKTINKVLMGAFPKQPLAGPIAAKSDGMDTRTLTFVVEVTGGTQTSVNLTLASTTLVETTRTDIVRIISASLSAPDSNRLVRLYYYQQYTDTGESPPIGYNDLLQIETMGSTFPTTGKTTSVVRRNHTWKPSVKGQYHVRMRRTTAAGDPTRDVDETTWTALRTIRYETPVVEPNCAMIEGRIRATEQLNGVIENFSAQPKSWLRTFDGTNWTDPVLTDNPAWAVVDILTGYNENIPELSVPLSAINGPSFKAFADWCTSNQFSFNYAFEDTDNMEDAARLAAAAGRGSIDEVDGEYVIVIDQPQTVIRQHFTPRNTWDFESSGTYPDVVHALRVKFKNYFLNFQDDERPVYADGYTKDNATIYELVEYRGITNPDQIYKFARYELAERLLIFEQMSFSVDLEQLMVTRGDLCKLSHDALLVGQGWGHIKAVEVSGGYVVAVKIDSSVFMLVGNTYGVSIRTTAENATIDAEVINEGATVNRLRFVTPLTGTLPAVGDLLTFGEWGEISQLVTVKDIRNIEDNGYMAARITTVPYVAGKFTADTEEIPEHTPIISIIDTPLNLRPPTPTIRSIRSDQDAANINDNGSYNAKISILVDFEPDFKPAQVFIQAQARLWLDPSVDSNPHQWINSPMEEGTNGELVINNVDVTLIYEVRVRSINKLNFSLVSPWSATQTHTVLGDTLAPDPPTGVSGLPGDRSAILAWTNPTDDAGGTLIDFDAVEVWGGLINDSAEALYLGETAADTFIVSDLVNGSTYYFWLRARDFAGNLSDYHATQYAGVTVAPASNVTINKDKALLASKTLQSLEDVLTLSFTTTGKKVQATARIFIDDSVLNSGDGSSWVIEFRRDLTVIDTFTYPMNRTGPGSPGMLTFTVQDQPAAGTYTYKLVYGGSTLAIEGRNLGIWVEEFRN